MSERDPRLLSAERLRDFREASTIPGRSWGGISISDLLDHIAAQEAERARELADLKVKHDAWLDRAKLADDLVQSISKELAKAKNQAAIDRRRDEITEQAGKLAEQLAEAKRDSERLDWLIKMRQPVCEHATLSWVSGGPAVNGDARAAIDASMAREKEQK